MKRRSQLVIKIVQQEVQLASVTVEIHRACSRPGEGAVTSTIIVLSCSQQLLPESAFQDLKAGDMVDKWLWIEVNCLALSMIQLPTFDEGARCHKEDTEL